MAKTLGWILLITGALAVALLFKPVNDFLKLPLGDFGITDTILTIAGVIAIIIGILMLRGPGKTKQKAAEVPIYHGKQIIGYRRT